MGGIQDRADSVLQVGPVRWIARHTAYEQDSLFVDEQIRGPFRFWVHRHEFEAIDGRTKLTDRIEYQLPGGTLVNLLFAWIVNARLGQHVPTTASRGPASSAKTLMTRRLQHPQRVSHQQRRDLDRRVVPSTTTIPLSVT
jgi:hypothetical protein